MSCGVGTGTLLAANAVTASFLGAAALKGGRLDGPAGLAVVCFALSLGAALFILLPRTGLRFSISGPVLYETLYEYGDDAEEIHRRTAYWLEEFWSSNQATIDGLYPWFTVAAVTLAVELVLWAVTSPVSCSHGRSSIPAATATAGTSGSWASGNARGQHRALIPTKHCGAPGDASEHLRSERRAPPERVCRSALGFRCRG